MQIKYSKNAIAFLNKQPKKSVERIRDGVAKLSLIPPKGDIAMMQGYSDNRKRLRIGSFRVIFKNQDGVLSIIDIGNRGDIYK